MMLPGNFSSATEYLVFSTLHSSRGSRPSPARAWLVLGAMSMLQFLIAVDVTVVNIALPSIGADFDVDAHSLTWVVVGYTITGGGLLMLVWATFWADAARC